MNENIIKMINYRITNPNNATNSLCKYLQDLGFEIVTNRNRKVVLLDDKFYSISITGYDNKHLECRQFAEDGLISLYEKTGQIYIIELEDLKIKFKNREFNNEEFRTATSLKNIEVLEVANIIQLDVNTYKLAYMDEAIKLADELVANTYRKLK
jgi:hypothetical protein